jgi:N-acetylglutamate synthase-like GNAT family acetyltransferase
MADETADSLREMAQHRGLKLVRSRRRKPGTGDYGKFGLTDDKGKALLGIGEDGLTASAEDIENYLRSGAASTWQQSARITPDRPPSPGKRKRDKGSDKAPRGGRSEADSGGVARRSATSSPRSARSPVPAAEAKSSAARGRKAPLRDETEPGETPLQGRQRSAARPEPVEVEPALVLRPAKPADAGALAELLNQLRGIAVSKDDVARELAALRKAGADIHLAELGAMVGCIAWCVVPTLQRGPVGRITALVVDGDYRRQGLGTQLLAVAEAALAKKGCALIEAMSDIEIKNSHNFFRALKFDQTSYRFARKIAG